MILAHFFSQVDKDAKTMGNLLISQMTSMNMALKYMVNELLFSLVGENGARDFLSDEIFSVKFFV